MQGNADEAPQIDVDMNRVLEKVTSSLAAKLADAERQIAFLQTALESALLGKQEVEDDNRRLRSQMTPTVIETEG